jgi:aspartyl-tRNA(Asn)/glutamyl-tRNA(Gln) amidotransferase subunit C
MSITNKEVAHIAKLSMLELDEAHFEKLANDMNAIVGMVDKLQELNIDEDAKKFTVDGNHNVFREDEVLPSFDREIILENAPSKNAGCFFVPKIVE